MSLDHLDDPNPPELDARRWQWLTQRSRTIVRHRRYGRASASLAVVTVLGAAVGWSVWSPDRSTVASISTRGSSSTTSSTSASSTSTPQSGASDWVTVELEVDQQVVTAGHDVTGNIVFDNHTSAPVPLTEGVCAAKWAVVVGAGSTDPGAAFAADCELASGAKSFAPGVTRVPFRAATTYFACGGTSRANPPIPKCLPGNRMPDLPTGAATVWFETDGPIPHLVPPPGPVAIQIVPTSAG